MSTNVPNPALKRPNQLRAIRERCQEVIDIIDENGAAPIQDAKIRALADAIGKAGKRTGFKVDELVTGLQQLGSDVSLTANEKSAIATILNKIARNI